MNVSYYIGVAAAVVAGIAFNLGILIQKLAVMKVSKSISLMRQLIRSPLWLSGFALQFFIGMPLNMLAQSKIGPAIIPGLMAIGLAVLAIGADDWEELKHNRQAYLARKDDCTKALIARAEEFLPGLRASIVVREAATPLTYERYTSNWRGGTSGWNWDPKDAPHYEFEKDLPIKRFFPIGHYVHNPGGVPTAMITAWYIARSIIRETRMI